MAKINKPPLRKPVAAAVNMDKLDEFASSSQNHGDTPGPPDRCEEETVNAVVVYPWEQPGVREDVMKGMGVPLSEPFLLKLRFIAEHTKWSQRKFCQVRLEEAIDNELGKILTDLKP